MEEGGSDNQVDEQISSDVSTNILTSNHTLLRSAIYPDEISSLTKLLSTAQFSAGMGYFHAAQNKSLVILSQKSNVLL